MLMQFCDPSFKRKEGSEGGRKERREEGRKEGRKEGKNYIYKLDMQLAIYLEWKENHNKTVELGSFSSLSSERVSRK